MRRERLEIHEFGDGTPLLHWTEVGSPLRVGFNLAVLQISKFLPLKFKNRLMELLGVDIGSGSAIALGTMLDIFHPEKISVGGNTTIGYNSTILTHETTQNEFRIGEVQIGDEVLIGANTTVLPGVKVEDGATVSANSLVNRDVEENEFVGGVPIQTIDNDKE